MSWEGHLSGFVMGVFFAFNKRNKGIVKKKHTFSKTEFDLLFDENGNFSPPKIDQNQENENRVEG